MGFSGPFRLKSHIIIPKIPKFKTEIHIALYITSWIIPVPQLSKHNQFVNVIFEIFFH